MPLLILFAVGLWFFFGDPPETVANTFWPEDAAPWETVDAFYYPNRNDLSDFRKVSGLQSVDECRDAVSSMAATYNDSSFTRGDYECGIEIVDNFYGMNVYRTTRQ